jgi:hypothetical protein
MSYYDTTPIRDQIQRITEEEAKMYIPLREDYTGINVSKCPYYTLTEGEDGWEMNHVFYRKKAQ